MKHKDGSRLRVRTVFISYSAVDQALALQISDLLTDLGIKHFVDKKDVRWGDEVVATIAEGLRTASHLLVIVSPASLKSSWVAFEIGNAVALGKTVLPLLTHPSLEVPDFIRQLHFKKDLASIKEYFTAPAVEPEVAANLFSLIFSSRLPNDLDRYRFCEAESRSAKVVWRSQNSVNSIHIAGDGFSRVSIVADGPHVEIEDYFTKGLYRRHRVFYEHDIPVGDISEGIEVQDRATVLEFGGKPRDSGKYLAASPELWAEVVKLLRAHVEQVTEAA